MVNEFQKELKPRGVELAGYAVDLESYVSNLADQVFNDSQNDRSVSYYFYHSRSSYYNRYMYSKL